MTQTQKLTKPQQNVINRMTWGATLKYDRQISAYIFDNDLANAPKREVVEKLLKLNLIKMTDESERFITFGTTSANGKG